MTKKQKVKKVIKFKDLIIKLYDYNMNHEGSISNIEAFDRSGNLLWQAEKPFGHYWDMQIDEDNNYLECDDGAATKYEIDLSDGHIIKYYIIK